MMEPPEYKSKALTLYKHIQSKVFCAANIDTVAFRVMTHCRLVGGYRGYSEPG
jgi:hypothetical protein